jgi:NAD(P)-dependent dehydrogenase (short-subunit alcohol dehydrogenase family)
MKGLKHKVAIVAGAAPGNIGGATAVRLAEEGAAVLAADLNEAAAQSVVDEVRAFGGKAASRRFDKPRRDSTSDSDATLRGVARFRRPIVRASARSVVA